jgi:hypothetical protein
MLHLRPSKWKYRKKMRKLYYSLMMVLMIGCNQKQNFVIEDFNPFFNYNSTKDTLYLKLDLTNTVLDGITIPSVDNHQTPIYFRFSFKIKNNSGTPQNFYYKIFYQNETYKFDEYLNTKGKVVYNPQASDNFYGSWENSKDEFHETGIIGNDNAFHLITDSFRILGNPREEIKYFGAESSKKDVLTENINEAISRIKKSDEWMREIVSKAEKNKISVDEQLYLDAKWVAEHEVKQGNFNNRWKRNPRMGNYEFILAVLNKKGLRKTPVYIKNINTIDEKTKAFLNPFYYFLYDPNKHENVIQHLKSDKILNTIAKIDVSKGIYIDNRVLEDSMFLADSTDKLCNSSEEMYRYAQFEQYFHNINKDFGLLNIPLVHDVIKDGYSLDEYNLNKEKYSGKDLIKDYIRITESPGRTVNYDSILNTIIIKNPGNDDNHPVKENVGIRTRIGFTYGKFRAKIKFPEILNDDNVWNGLTCAFWLLYQEDADWNRRGICSDLGYIPKGEVGKTDIRTNATYYSEIDIEIVKASKYWPKTSYKNTENYPVDNSASNKNLIIACTNWDLACREPSRFIVGAENFKVDDRVFVLHRWDDWYQALTSKYENPHDETVGNVLYYEIDWQPDKIIWRIGKSKDQMKMIGYMDNTVTKIPDNQMIAIITQEFHYAAWWPTSPFIQDYIPYPKNDIVGYVYEIEIE